MPAPGRLIGLQALEKIVFGRRQIRSFNGVAGDIMPGESNNWIICRFARRAAF